MKNAKTKVKLRDSKKATEVLRWIINNWKVDKKCIFTCPIGIGEILTLIHYESMDITTKKNGRPTYFNAIGGPYGSKVFSKTYKKIIRTTAVGLAQFTEATRSRAIAYNGQASVKEMITIAFKGVKITGCTFNIDI